MKSPLDDRLYERDPQTRELVPGIDDGVYVFVQDLNGIVFVLPDGSHRHPRFFGGAENQQCTPVT